MAHRVRPQIVRGVDTVTGKRATKGTPEAMTEQERTRKWYGVSIPG